MPQFSENTLTIKVLVSHSGYIQLVGFFSYPLYVRNLKTAYIIYCNQADRREFIDVYGKSDSIEFISIELVQIWTSKHLVPAHKYMFR